METAATLSMMLYVAYSMWTILKLETRLNKLEAQAEKDKNGYTPTQI